LPLENNPEAKIYEARVSPELPVTVTFPVTLGLDRDILTHLDFLKGNRAPPEELVFLEGDHL